MTDLLDVSRIQRGRLIFNEERFDLNLCVKETVENIRTTTKDHKIIIKGKALQPIWGNKDRIAQVLINLLTNAIKYSPNSSKILVTLGSDKNEAKVTVKDYGIGIKKDFQKKIFKLFYRVNTPEGATYPGMGVGLYISRQIVKRHGGSFEIKSVYGKGSEFSFTIPYIK